MVYGHNFKEKCFLKVVERDINTLHKIESSIYKRFALKLKEIYNLYKFSNKMSWQNNYTGSIRKNEVNPLITENYRLFDQNEFKDAIF